MKDKFELFFFFMVLLIFGSMSYAIITTASAHTVEPPREPTWTPPEIPQCDKELWLRIKDGCNE